MKHKVGIFGAATPAGIELMRVISIHPMMELVFVTDDLHAGELVKDRFPGLAVNVRLSFSDLDTAPANDVDLAFSALPLRVAAETVPRLRREHPDTKLVDLSPLYRPMDKEMFHRFYGLRHPAPELAADFIYGVCQSHAGEVKNAPAAAIPGAIAAAAIVALAPYAKRGLLKGRVQLVATVGTSETELSGSPTVTEAEGNVRAARVLDYGQLMELTYWLGGDDAPFELVLVPQIGPFARGVYLTAFIDLPENMTLAAVDQLYRRYYDDSPFVQLLSEPPELRHVLWSNRAHLYLRVLGETLTALVALDNLGRGSAMQAVECANLMLGLPAEIGLMFPGRSG